MKKEKTVSEAVDTKKPKDEYLFQKSKSYKATKITYWVLQFLTLGTVIASLVRYFVSDVGLETTAMQVFMGVLSLLIFNVPAILERRYRVFVPPYLSLLLYALLFAHFVLGEIYRVYDVSRLFDKILHTTSGVTIALLSFSIISLLNNLPKNRMKLSPFFMVLFTFCFTMTAEYLWEIFEYLMDNMFGGNMQRWNDSLYGILQNGQIITGSSGIKASDIGSEGTQLYLHTVARGNGLADSMGDMIVNIFGALAVCIYAYIGMKVKKDWFSKKVIMPVHQAEEMFIKSELKDKNVADGEESSVLVDGVVEKEHNFTVTEENSESLAAAEESIFGADIVSIPGGISTSEHLIVSPMTPPDTVVVKEKRARRLPKNDEIKP